jgi:glycosyltransferase involved in cell wall biosynthesis
VVYGRGDYDDEITSLGGRIYYLPNVKRNPILRFIQLRNLIKNNSYHVVHKHSANANGWLDLMAAKAGNARTRIYHAHGGTTQNNNLVQYFFRILVNCFSTHKLVPSKLTGEIVFGKKQCNNEIVKVIPNFIDVERFKFNSIVRERVRNELGLHDKYVIGYVSRFDPVKNHKFLLEIFHEVYNYNKDVILLLVGDGELRPDIEAQIDSLDLFDAVKLLGVRDDIYDLYQAMDVYVIPSLNEGFPLAATEAQASGLPCVLSNTITEEVVLCETCIRLELSSKSDDWVDAILNKHRISNGHEQVRNAGYDIKEGITQWSRMYMME